MSKWDKVKVKQAFSYVSRGKSPNYTEMSVTRVINQACIYWDGLHLKNVKYQDSALVNADRYLNNNDVLINSTGTGTLGRCCVFTLNSNDMNYIVDSHVTVLRPSDDICSSFFKYFIMRKETQDCIYSKCVSGSTNQIELSKGKLLEFLIPLPPLETQKQIAKTLDTTTELLAMRKHQLSELDALIKSTFYDMFGDPATNPMGWKTGIIKDLAVKIQYGTSEKASIENLPYPILRMGNITYQGDMDFSNMKYIDLSEKDKEKYLVHKGEMLFNRTNSKELVGKTAVYREDKPMAYAGYLVRLVPKEKANSELISAYLNSLRGKKLLLNMAKNIVGMANINAQELSKIEIFIPPIILQTQFAEIVIKIEEQKALVKKAIDETQVLFDSLMSEYFE